MDWAAALYALTAAGLFGFNVHIHRKGLGGTDGWTGAFLSVASMTVAFWAISPLFVDPAWFQTRGALVFLAVGLFFPALGQTFQIQSVAKIGPALTAALTTFTPLFAILLAVMFMGEPFGWLHTVALGMMIGGLLLAALPKRGFARGWPLWALLLPLGASLVRGISQPAIKAGMADVPSPFFAALLSGTVSAVLLGGLARAKNPSGFSGVKSAHGWFVLSGLINGVGILALNAALNSGAIVIVSPLAATAPLFALGFGAFVFRHEVLTLRHWLIVGLVVAGAILLVTT